MKATEIQKQRMKEYSQIPEVKIKRKEYMKNYLKEYESNNKQKISNRKKIYYLKNKLRIDQRNKLWHQNNKEKFRLYLDEYFLDNKNIEKRRENSSKWYNSVDNKKVFNKKELTIALIKFFY